MKKFLGLMTLVCSLFLVACSDGPVTSGNSGEGIKVPEFVGGNTGAGRFVDFYTLATTGHATEMYYCNFCPAIISFKEDSSVSAGDSFTKNILGVPVSFVTSQTGNVITYNGHSTGDDIQISMTYNIATNELSYNQSMFAKNGDGKCLIINTSFNTTIKNGVIHTISTIKMVFEKYEEGNRIAGKLETGEGRVEVYIDNDKSGFCTLKLGGNIVGSELELKPENLTALIALVNINKSSMQPIYSLGKQENNDVDVVMNGNEIKKDNTRADAEAYCPWTLFSKQYIDNAV